MGIVKQILNIPEEVSITSFVVFKIDEVAGSESLPSMTRLQNVLAPKNRQKKLVSIQLGCTN